MPRWLLGEEGTGGRRLVRSGRIGSVLASAGADEGPICSLVVHMDVRSLHIVGK